MVVLTWAEARDLRYLVALYRLTIGLTLHDGRRLRGDSVRTGRSLAKKGLVGPAPDVFSNRVGTWTPTSDGLKYVGQQFRAFDDHAEEAISMAMRFLREIH